MYDWSIMPVSGRAVGRYVLCDEIAAGGMATVHLGRLIGSAGFSRTVAIKCLHPHLTREPQFVSMLLDEAHLASRVRHPNVVPTIDVVAEQGEVVLVMEYVHGESLAKLIQLAKDRTSRIPISVVVSILAGALSGLHAAHEALSERGTALGIVHRDVSPQNVLIGIDGVARVFDFGIAKAASRLQNTGEGQLKGKLRYMSPEQLSGQQLDRRADIFAASVVLWEALTCRRLFDAQDAGAILTQILQGQVRAPSSWRAELPLSLDAIVMRGLSKRREDRFDTAHDMAVALEAAVAPATTREVGAWVVTVAGADLDARSRRVTDIEGARGNLGELPAGRSEEPTAPLSPTLKADGPKPSTPQPTGARTASTALRANAEAPEHVNRGETSPSTHFTGVAQPPRRTIASPRRLWPAVLLASLLASALTGLSLWNSASLQGPDVAAIAPAHAPPHTVHATPTDLPIPDEMKSPPPAASVDNALIGTTSATAATTSRTPPRSFGARRPRSRIDCDPPFTIENGIKQFKANCL